MGKHMKSISSSSSSSSLKEFDHQRVEDEELVTLSLSTSPMSSAIPPFQVDFASPMASLTPPISPQMLNASHITLAPPPSQSCDLPTSRPNGTGPSQQRLPRRRKSPVQTLRRPGKTETIAAPYPWATTRRATVHNLQYLLSNGIDKISGEVQCKRCDRQYEVEYDLQEKFVEVAAFISENKSYMHDRAPPVWMNPTLPNCKFCEQSNCVKPTISKKRSINWLFLLLGQILGCCKLAELKYFCKHTKNHRTGAKDRVLYLTYLGLCKQLDPDGPFDR